MSSSARRCLRVLETVGAAARPLGVTEIARRLSLPPGTVFRSLDALSRSGLIARYQASSRYVLGEAAERLRRNVIAHFPMRDVCLPYLRQLASLSGEAVALHVSLGWYGVRIACLPGMGEVSSAPPLGESRPLGNLYTGRAILAFRPAHEFAAYRAWAKDKQLEPVSAARLRTVRERGFDLGDAVFGDGRMPIAFPIVLNQSAIAAVAIEGPVTARKGPTPPEGLLGWRAILAEIEALAGKKPELFENPFAHLAPASIAL
jgi:IclR family acetate operon transcriptional repressor